jgi:hypothetical protein
MQNVGSVALRHHERRPRGNPIWMETALQDEPTGDIPMHALDVPLPLGPIFRPNEG